MSLCLVVAMNMVATAPSGSAWSSLGCKWSVKNIPYSTSSSHPWYSTITAGASKWSNLDAKFSLNNNTGGHMFTVVSEARGNTVTWSGVFRRLSTVESNPAASTTSCKNGKWVSNQVQIAINHTLMESLNYKTAWRKGVVAHEFGHAFGLAHNNATEGGCPTALGKSKALYLMYYSDTRFTSTCATITGPKSDDKDGVNALY